TSPLNTNANNQQTQDDGTKKNRCSKEDTYRFMEEPKSWLFCKLFDPDEVIEILEKLIPEYHDPQLYLKLRDAYKKKDNDKLTIYYSELAFKDSNYIISEIKYAQNLIMKGDNEEAKQILQDILSKEEIENMPYEKYFAQEQLMKCHYFMREPEEALKLAKEVICTYKQQREQDIRPYISAACTNITSLLKLNRPWKQEADELYAQYPNNYIVLSTLTQAYIEDGNTKKARELIGHFYKTINIETVDNNVAKENRIIDFNLKEAKCDEYQNDIDDAEAIYKRLLNKYPNSFKIVYPYSDFLQYSRNNLDKAEEILKTLRNEPEQISDNLLLEERILKCQGKQMPMSKEVFDSAKKLSERFQNNPDITYATASIYFNAFLLTNQNILLEKAREQAEISDKLKPNNAKCIRLLAHIYRLVGLDNIARQCWNRAATLDNKHGDNRLNEQQKSWKELEAQRRKRKYPEKTCTQTIKNFSSLKEYLKNEGKEQNEESSSPSEVFTQVELFQNDNPIIKGKYKQF
ncbi:MAG: tetratricopeptide repeat protein, partial [Endozoicomonadaceae bacterium]|nr:tetratricopeptide repeat protein [Endozoicomonadaceae bacterium]